MNEENIRSAWKDLNYIIRTAERDNGYSRKELLGDLKSAFIEIGDELESENSLKDDTGDNNSP